MLCIGWSVRVAQARSHAIPHACGRREPFVVRRAVSVWCSGEVAFAAIFTTEGGFLTSDFRSREAFGVRATRRRFLTSATVPGGRVENL